ncbi:Lar family restriction alleviation protein [Paraburkholderia sp. SARCC-3016]|uniref:Lar family restriction alleviation protein n=1 Tax=Paraburkholderia sp. SARCC-3016 TaxID=3058611 RepID=UPI00280972B6|nr:Lar family restriction alleviation protein [Paraburkholderia sp. SARCC-3016]MDQ7980348.1 Lar family restriction alleviation protein [Paraburkholderia sp. SARCC-3016]
MIEQLFPCPHCGGRPKVGRSQRVVARFGDAEYDYSEFGKDAGPPRLGDTLPRPLTAPQTEKLVSIFCMECGVTTDWESVGDNEKAALERCAAVWNRRLDRPATTNGSLQDLIEKEVGACDVQYVLNLLARNEGDWAERGPIFAQLAQRLVDATVVTIDSWPIDPVLHDAARYRKLMQLAKWVDIDGERHIQFPKVPTPREHNDMLFEDRIAAAIDSMPDRDRW